MLIQPIDYALLVWFAIAGMSAAYVAYDQWRHNPEPSVMRAGFVLVTLYMGPFGLLLYVLADKEPRPGTHEEFVKPLWKQGVGSTIHCVAGDATGIILAAVITASLGLPMWLDLIVEYATGFGFGLFIFQSLFMKDMMGGTYWQNVRRSFLPEFISMNAMMAGMGSLMSFLMMGRDMRAMDPLELLFWGVMSLGVIVGFATAYPVNVWLVAEQLKHGLMTERKKGGPFDLLVPYEGTKEEHSSESDAHDQAGHGAEKQQTHSMVSGVTTPQLFSVTALSVVLLLTGLIAPANWINLRLSAKQVGGLIMPPGMIMPRDTSAEKMQEMAAVHPRLVTREYGMDTRGDQPLEPRIENGVKVFSLEVSVIRWHILPNVAVDAFAYNGQIPGPRIRVSQGDHVRIVVHSQLPESTTVHWHGLILPNKMDGPAFITQDPIRTGDSYSYEFTADQAGTFFYHSHDHPDRQQGLGLYGAFIIDPLTPEKDEPKVDLEYVIQLQEWLVREGLTYPAMLMEGGLPNYFTINGRAYPSTDVIHMKVGQSVKLRFIGTSNNFIHPMHVHGGPFTVVARDGVTLSSSARYEADTINLGSGQRYDVIWPARRPGKWLIHCHIPHHTENDNVEEHGGGGLMMLVDVVDK
jgi:FtsP/CotA-like multicopper oxidase with cupredoxin domain